ncbi:MAG: hypothetical protein NZ521_10540, partial [Flammeovirgaceae bacterium]|nr:hypothetical protein [Flammeovirgaceae bacterium]
MNFTTTMLQRFFWKALSMMLFAVAANAQNPGPAGVGNHTGAGGHPRNVLWLRADAGVFPNAGCTGTITDGANVNCWQDQSGNGLHATLTPTDKPVYLATGLGGRPALRFDDDATDGPERRISVPDNALLDFSTAATIIIVAQQDFAATNPKGLYYKRQSAGNQEAYGLWRNGGGTMVARISQNGTTAFNVDLGMPTIGSPFIYSYVFDAGGPANNKLTAIINSTSSNTGTDVTSIFDSAHPLNIGTFHVGDNRCFPGRISEMILYNATLTPPQRIIIENYLSQKYGVNIGTNDNFGNATSYNTAFVHDIIGIGTVNGTVKHSTPTRGSGALYLSEAHSTLDETNEFVILAHNNTAHAVVTSDLGTHVTERWARSWYIEKNRNGGSVDDATVDIKLNFDFGDAGITLGSVTEYALLYRPNNSGNFEILSTAS